MFTLGLCHIEKPWMFAISFLNILEKSGTFSSLYQYNPFVHIATETMQVMQKEQNVYVYLQGISLWFII